MTTPPNIDLFNRFALAVFRRLYLSFPVAVELDVNELIMSVTPTNAAYEESFNALSVGGEALNFLASEGFLVHQGALLDGSQFLQVRLTMKGLAVLGSMPAALERKESLITKILAISGKGLKDAASEQVQELASQAFAFALASAPAVAALIVRP